MYPKRKAKTDRERFLEAFSKKVGTSPEIYVKRKLAAGVEPTQLRQLYDLLAVEIARRAHCTAIRYDALALNGPTQAERITRQAAQGKVPVCPRCGVQMVLRTGQKGPRRGQHFWGCTNFPVCRCTKEFTER